MSRPTASPSLYRRIHAELESKIRSGEWRAGMQVPVEHALVKHYGCARGTVNKAMCALAQAGLIERRPRLGSFVAQPRIAAAVIEIPDIQAQIESAGGRYAFRLLRRRARRAAVGNAEELGLAAGEPLLSLRGLHLMNGMPFALEERLISLAVVPEAAAEQFRARAPGAWLLEHPLLRLSWTEAENCISAINLDPAAAALLKIAAHSACLAVERRSWRAGAQITYVRTVFRGDSYALRERFTPSRARSTRPETAGARAAPRGRVRR